ncbi:cupin domain-containing protein [Xanthobacteraceae bacterium A53D]
MEPDASHLVQIGDLELHFITSGGSATVFEFVVPSHARVPAPHLHEEVDEVIYGLEGILTVTVNGRDEEIGPGASIVIPRGTVHHHRNVHPNVARILAVMTPGKIERSYFEEMAALANGPARPDPATIRETMLRHGLTPA